MSDERARPWDEYLRTYHRDVANATWDGRAPFLTADGKSTYRLLAETLAEFARGNPAPRVLDLGCGDGRLVEDALAVRPRAVVTGLDLSQDEIARAVASGRHATFVNANATSMPFAPHSFDAVLSHFAFMLMVPVEEVVAEVVRVLAPGGYFATAFTWLAESSGDLSDLLALKNAAHGEQRHPSRPQFDPRQVTPEGIAELFAQAGDKRELVHQTELVTVDVDAEGAWRYLGTLYFFETLPDETQLELRTKVEQLVASRGGSLRLADRVHLIVLRGSS